LSAPASITARASSATDGERDEQALRDGADRVEQRAAAFDRRGDVEHRQLVDALLVVARRELGRIAGLAQPFEVDALDDGAVANVEAGDEPFGEHVSAPRSRCA
jgi:hypothetical protein